MGQGQIGEAAGENDGNGKPIGNALNAQKITTTTTTTTGTTPHLVALSSSSSLIKPPISSSSLSATATSPPKSLVPPKSSPPTLPPPQSTTSASGSSQSKSFADTLPSATIATATSNNPTPSNVNVSPDQMNPPASPATTSSVSGGTITSTGTNLSFSSQLAIDSSTFTLGSDAASSSAAAATNNSSINAYNSSYNTAASSSKSMMAGIICGSILAILLVVGLLVLYRRKRTATRVESSTMSTVEAGKYPVSLLETNATAFSSASTMPIINGRSSSASHLVSQNLKLAPLPSSISSPSVSTLSDAVGVTSPSPPYTSKCSEFKEASLLNNSYSTDVAGSVVTPGYLLYALANASP